MANILSQIGIETTNIVEAWHVTQSIDAFTGVVDYDISLSGSFNMTGSINGEPGVINPLTASYAITTSYAESSSYALTASYAVSASYALTASYAVSASYEINYETSSSYAETASIAESASYASTASYVSLVAGPNITINQAGTSFEISASSGGSLDTGSFYYSSSVNSNIITFHQGDGTTESVTVNTGSAFMTWITCSITTLTIPTGNIGVIINYSGGNQVTLDLQNGNVGDIVEIVTLQQAEGRIAVDYDGGTIKAWSTGSASGGSVRTANVAVDPTFKFVYVGNNIWNLVYYLDNDMAVSTAVAVYDQLEFLST